MSQRSLADLKELILANESSDAEKIRKLSDYCDRKWVGGRARKARLQGVQIMPQIAMRKNRRHDARPELGAKATSTEYRRPGSRVEREFDADGRLIKWQLDR